MFGYSFRQLIISAFAVLIHVSFLWLPPAGFEEVEPFRRSRGREELALPPGLEAEPGRNLCCVSI